MANGSRGGGFREQYDRMLRWFERFKSISEGQVHTDNSDFYEDTMRTFFETCYHLKDWVKNDPRSGYHRRTSKTSSTRRQPCGSAPTSPTATSS